MSEWIAMRIMNACDGGGEAAGQGKYKAYFMSNTKMNKYKAGTDSILKIEGYYNCIVEV